ncbi:helix-turn-helix domain-containing protein [Enterococcus faecalis]|nr:helix-turn-helix domain-containing protein [Enterococcus faecalis]
MVKVKQTTILIYLLAIQKLSQKKVNIKNNELATILNVTPPSVSEMLNKLIAEGFVSSEQIKLTSKGNKFIAEFKKRII